MNRPFVPQEIVDLAHARREARGRRAWDEADDFKVRIEAAGWRVVDRGVDFDLRPARPADVVADGEVRYGSSESVPSRLDEPDVGPLSALVILNDLADVATLRAGLVAVEAGAMVIVANGLGPEAEADLRAIAEAGAEVVRLAGRGSPGLARNAGVRRATGTVVLILGTAADSPGISAMAAEFADPAVAVVGSVGLVSAGLPRFTETSERRVDAVSGDIAFRRTDYREHGPFDERFATARELDIWWSLTLRDTDEEHQRLAVRIGDADNLPPKGPRTPDVPETPGQRRDRYRLLDAFRGRDDLLSGARSDSDGGGPDGGGPDPGSTDRD